jgi:hypothetical protein
MKATSVIDWAYCLVVAVTYALLSWGLLPGFLVKWAYYLVVAATYAFLSWGLLLAILHSHYGITLGIVLLPFCIVGIVILLKRPFLLRDSCIFLVGSALIALYLHLLFPMVGIVQLMEFTLFVHSLLLCAATIYRGILEYFVNRLLINRGTIWRGNADGLMLFACKKCFYSGLMPFPVSAFQKGLYTVCSKEKCGYLNKFGRHRFQHIPNPYKTS